MFKILIALSLFIAIQGQPLGGFTDRPDLIEAPATQNMVKLAVGDLAQNENLLVSPVDVLSVATQLVNGLNYRIAFTARSSSSDNVLVCIAKLYEPIGGSPTVSEVNCA